MQLRQSGIPLSRPFTAFYLLESDDNPKQPPTDGSQGQPRSSDDDSVDNVDDSKGGYGRSSGFTPDA